MNSTPVSTLFSSATLAEASSAAPVSRRERFFYVVLLLLLVCGIWVRRLDQSFWLDETLTVWLTEAGWFEALRRTKGIFWQASLQLMIPAFLQDLGARSEVWIRLPSVLLGVVTLVLLFRLARILFGERAAWSSLCLFVPLDGAMLAFVSVRPYALAMCFAVAAMLFSLSYLREGRTVQLGVAGLSGALAIYTHLLFAGVLGVPLIYALCRYCAFLPRLTVVRRSVSILVGTALLAAPLGPLLWQLLFGVPDLKSPGDPQISELLVALFPPAPLVLLGIALLTGGAMTHGSVAWTRIRFLPRAETLATFFWYLGPPIAFYVLASMLHTGQVMALRYFLWYLPGCAVALGAVLAVIASPRALQLTLGIFTVLILLAEPHRPIFSERWRDLGAELRTRVTTDMEAVVFYPGLTESTRIGNLSDELLREYLAAPLRVYGYHGEVLLVPFRVRGAAEDEYWLDQIAPRLVRGDVIAVVGNDVISFDGQPVSRLVEDRVKESGIRVCAKQTFGKVWIFGIRQPCDS